MVISTADLSKGDEKMAHWTDCIKGRFGFGCMRLPMVDGEVDYDLTCRMFDAFLDAGLNYFDTAHRYLGGQSEVAVRKCLVERHPRESFVLTDKLSTHCFTREDQIDDNLADELAACGVEYFDILLMHALNKETYAKYQRLHAFEHVNAFVAAGKARHMGISFHDTPGLLEQILDDHPEIEIVQIQLNYVDFDDPAIQSRRCYEVLEERGIPSIIMEPVKGGVLASLPERAQAVIDALPNPCGLSNAGYALRFCTTLLGVRMVLSGMNTMEQVRENLSAMLDPQPLGEDELAALARIHDIFFDSGMIECTACHYCTDGCPRRIHIPELFGCLNTKRVFGGWNAGWYYDNVHTAGEAGKASDCIRCGACERACPQHLPIRDLLLDVVAEFEKPAS